MKNKLHKTDWQKIFIRYSIYIALLTLLAAFTYDTKRHLAIYIYARQNPEVVEAVMARDKHLQAEKDKELKEQILGNLEIIKK